MKKGKFIVIEGPDGTGKKTQTDLLEARLKSAGYVVAKYDFPQYETTFFGEMVGNFLNGDYGQLDEVDPHLASVLYAADRWQASNNIYRLKEEGKIVLANRYRLSNVAHQSAKIQPDKRKEFIRFLDKMELDEFQIPKEDINVILHISPEKARELIEQKAKRNYLSEGKKLDIHERDMKYQTEVAKIYRELPQMYPDVVGIDCEINGNLMLPEVIGELVWSEVSSRLGLHVEGRITRDREA